MDLLKKNIISKIINITNIKDPKVIFVSAKKYDGQKELTNLIIEESKVR